MNMVSIVIPYYNSEGTIVRALESVVYQTFTDYEVILVDDGSIDKSHQIVDEYINEYKNIHFKHYLQQNSGPADARNLGISKADGKFIAFLDADDSWISNKLQIQMMIIKENKIDLLGSNINIVKAAGIIIPKYYVRSRLEYISFYKMLFRHYFCIPSVIIRKIVLENIGGFPNNQRYAEDTLLFTRIVREYKSAVSNDFLVNIYKPLFGYAGLSADNKETNKHEIHNFKVLKKENYLSNKKISTPLYYILLCFTYLKYLRKNIVTFCWKLKNKQKK